MLDRAQLAQWEEVSEMEVTRRELLDAFFLSPDPADLALTLADEIRYILEIDQQIMELGRIEKLELEQVLRQIDHGKKAIKAYIS